MPITRRQHFIPRLLLRGFDCGRPGKDATVVVYRKATTPFFTIVDNIGQQRDFYGAAPETGVEDALSRLEDIAKHAIFRLREGGDIVESDHETIERFARTQSARTRSLRLGFVELVESLLAQMNTVEGRHRIIELAKDRALQLLDKAMKEALAGLGLERLHDDRIVNELKARLLPVVVARAESMDDELRLILEAISGNSAWSNAAQVGQVDALQRFASDPNHELRNTRRWRVVRLPPHSLILGDQGVTALIPSTGMFLTTALAAATDAVLLLPIAHDCLLVGESAARLACIDIQRINKGVAEVSSEFFVASREDAVYGEFASRIGLGSGLIDSAGISEIVEKLGEK